MNIQFSDAQQKFIASLMNSGNFAREEDVIVAGINALQQKIIREKLQREIFERDIAPALRQLDEGAGRVLEVEQFLAARNSL